LIIVQLKGGLGNQMFQYAAGRALSIRTGAPLLLDMGSYEPRQAGMYALDGLQIQAEPAAPEQLKAFQPGIFGKALNRLLPLPLRRIYKEPHFQYDARFGQARPPLYMKGYWQSWKYFDAVKTQIREDFRFRQQFSPAILAKAAELEATESVAMHFRRGDYTQNVAVQYHGICGPDYYERAVEQLPAAVRYYIFTNDPDWVRENLPPGISANILSGSLSHNQYEDLFLMSRCRHQVIANSSYSWWAAWLNDYAGKKVIAPRRWFNEARLNTDDLIPSNWLTV
jgi:hypothetical protein